MRTEKREYNSSNWFNFDNEPMLYGGKTYASSNQHGTGKLVNDIFGKYPKMNATMEKTRTN